jgi:hypothetical protein
MARGGANTWGKLMPATVWADRPRRARTAYLLRQ